MRDRRVSNGAVILDCLQGFFLRKWEGKALRTRQRFKCTTCHLSLRCSQLTHCPNHRLYSGLECLRRRLVSPGEEYETYLLRVFSLDTSETKIAASYSTVADPVEGPGGPVPSLFLDQTEARRFENNFLGDFPPPLPLSQGLDPAP